MTTTNKMSAKYPHLLVQAGELADAADDVRIRAIQAGGWIGYPRAREVIDQMEALLNHPPIERMPNLLLVGPTNNGKTQILSRFLARHPPTPDPAGDITLTPVVLVAAPPTPDIGDLCVRILEFVGAPYREIGTPAERIRTVKRILGRLQTRLLLIDDIQHMLSGGPVKQREFRNAIKDLGNALKMSIVAAGIEEAYTVFATDPQLSNRFPVETLPVWRLDIETGRFLSTLECQLPLRNPSGLKAPELLQQIVFMSEGPIGEMHSVVKLAAIHAIKNGREAITLELLKTLRWTPPSQRRGRPAAV